MVQRYQQVAPNLSPQEYQAAAQQSFARMTPEQRMQFGQQLQQQGGMGSGLSASSQQYQDPGYLAQATTQLHQQQPGLLSGLLGGSGGGDGNPLAKAVLAGIATAAMSKALGGQGARGVSGGGRYTIRSIASQKLLADPEASRDNGAKIIQWDDSGGADQQWSMDTGPHGGAWLANAASGKLLANPEGSGANGTQMIQWEPNGGPEQEWLLELGPSGGVRLRNTASHKLLANPEGSHNNGTNIIQWQADGGPEQEWLFDPPCSFAEEARACSGRTSNGRIAGGGAPGAHAGRGKREVQETQRASFWSTAGGTPYPAKQSDSSKGDSEQECSEQWQLSRISQQTTRICVHVRISR